ncbi:hypothetical protein ACWV95_20160 [Streptomyces albus]
MSLLTLVRAASSAGYELPGLGDPLVLEAAEFYDRAGEALVPAEGLSPEWERALVPPHRQLVDPVPGYFAVDRVEHLDDEGRLRVSGFFNGPDVSVRGFYDVLPRVTEVVFWSRDGRGSLVGVSGAVPWLEQRERTAFVAAREGAWADRWARVRWAAVRAARDGMSDLVVLAGAGIRDAGAWEEFARLRAEVEAASGVRVHGVFAPVRGVSGGVESALPVPVAVTPERGEVPARIHVLGDVVPGEAGWVSGAQGVVSRPEPSAGEAVWVGAEHYPDRVYWNAPVEVTHPAQYPHLYADDEWADSQATYEIALGRALSQSERATRPLPTVADRLWQLLAEHHGHEAAARAFFPGADSDEAAVEGLHALLSEGSTPEAREQLYRALRRAIGGVGRAPYTLTELLRTRPDVNTHGLRTGEPGELPAAVVLDDAQGRGLWTSQNVENHQRVFLAARMLGLSPEELLDLRTEVLAFTLSFNNEEGGLLDVLRAAHAAGVRAGTDPDLAVVDAAALDDWAHAELLPQLDVERLTESERAELKRPHHRAFERLERRWPLPQDTRHEELSVLDDPSALDTGDAFLQIAPRTRREYAYFLEQHGTRGLLKANLDRARHWALSRALSDAGLFGEWSGYDAASAREALLQRVERSWMPPAPVCARTRRRCGRTRASTNSSNAERRLPN